MKIKIITVGSKNDYHIAKLIGEYEKRLSSHIELTWSYVKPASSNPHTNKLQETERILKLVSEKDFVILLDETGEQINNEKLKSKIFSPVNNIVFVIGGAYGVDENIKKRADFIWALSELVIPHKIVRLILAEQIYRSLSIHSGHPYHHS